MRRFTNSCAQNCEANVNSEFIVERGMSPSTIRKIIILIADDNTSGISTRSSARSFRPCSNLFRTGYDLQSESREVDRILVSTVSSSNSHQALFVPTWTSLTSGRALHCCKKNAFNSMCLVLRVEPLRLIIPSAAEESQHWICCVVSFVSSALHPNFHNQFHCCHKLMPSQAPESAATNSASPRLTAIVDWFLRDAVIGYQPCLPRNHDPVPLTLNRSASLAQSESPYVNTEPTGALFTASRLSVVGRTFMIPGFPRKCRRIDLTFLMSVSLARPRLDEGFAIAQRRSARSIHNSFPTSCRQTLCSLAGISVSLVSRRSHRGVGELLSADMLNSSSMLSTYEASHLLCLYQGSSQVARWFSRHLAAFELQVSAQFSEDFCDDLVRSSQQQVVHVEYE